MEIVKILIVEDDIGFAYLVQHQLTNLGFQSQFILTVHTLEDARLAHLEFEIDVILLDLNLKESQGIETFNEINSIFPSASIIVLTGLDEKALALNIVAKGAQDYLLKTNLSSQVLEKTINYGMLRRKVRVELSKSEKKYKDVFQKSPLPMLKLEGSELIVVMANKAALDLYSVNKEDFIGQSIYSFNKFQEEKFIELETSNSIRTIFNLKTSDKNDDVKFVNDTQVKRFIDAGQDPFERATNSAKIGRTVRQILTANNISVTDQQIEKFVNTYKNAWDKSFKKTSEGIHLVSGEDIRNWYLESKYVPGGGQLNNSCMRYDKCQKYLDIYVSENADTVYSEYSDQSYYREDTVWSNILNDYLHKNDAS